MARGNSYLLAVGAVALGIAVRWVVDPTLQDTRLPFFTFFPAVFFAAWIGGARPALLATALSILAVWGMFLAPRSGGEPPDAFAMVSLGLFGVIGACCGWLGQARLDAQAAAERARAIADESAMRAREEAARAEAEAARAEEEAALAEEERLRAEEETARAEATSAALQDSEARFKTLADGAPVLIWVNGLDGCEFVNQSYLDFIGVPAAVNVRGYDWAAYIHPEDREQYLEAYTVAFRARAVFEAQFRFLRHDGQYRYMKSTGRPRYDARGTFVGFVGGTVDITDLKEAEELVRAGEDRLRQSAKMEAIGRLAGGLAHDLNNQLYAVAGFAEFISRDPGLAARAREDLLQLRSAVDRMAGLTRQLLAFSRQQVLTPETLDLNAAVSDVKPMLERLIGRNVTMTVSLAPAPLWVRVDRSQLTQVLLNLAINARDAMPDGGEVRLLTDIRSIEANGAESNGALAPGRYAELVVRDTGMGIPPEHLPRIFEPFFTTKAVGQGTGLGLATVHGIVSQSGGQVWAVSDAGGAAFTVLLPLTDAPGPATMRSGGDGHSPQPARILVVDDEDLVRSVMARCLEEEGYAVVQARNGREALERLADDGSIDLVLSDLVMPVMSGRELARELSSRRPELPVLWISGHPWEPALGDAPRQPAEPVLQKPVAAAALREAVAGALHRARWRVSPQP